MIASFPHRFQVRKVEYVVNPKLVKKFKYVLLSANTIPMFINKMKKKLVSSTLDIISSKAQEDMKKNRGEEYSHAILAFHGTDEKSITPIVETGFRIPGT